MGSKAENNKAIVLSFYKAVDRADRAEACALLHSEFTMRLPGTRQRMGAGEYWQHVGVYRTLLHDLVHRCDVVAAESDNVFVQGDVVAKVAGRTVDIPFLSVALIRDGKILELSALIDAKLMESQLDSGAAS